MKLKYYSEHGFPLKRATPGSAGYDILAPRRIQMAPGTPKLIIKTGLRVKLEDYEKPHVLMVFPRSSTGIKYNTRLLNSVGIIDSDYCGPDDEIMVALYRGKDDGETKVWEKGDAFAQLVVMPILTPESEMVSRDQLVGANRGGIGSTDDVEIFK